MRNLLTLLCLAICVISASAKGTKRKEAKALKKLNKILKVADKDHHYLIETFDEFNQLLIDLKSDEFEQKISELDSILTKCDLNRNHHLNTDILYSCIKRKRKSVRKKLRETSFYQFYEFVKKISSNPSMLEDTSPTLIQKSLNTILKDEDRKKDFYKAFSLLITQGVHLELKNGESANQNSVTKTHDKKGKLSIVDTEKDVDVDVDVEVTPIYTDKEKEVLVFEIVDEVRPRFKGGRKALAKYLELHSKETEGRILVLFTINQEGEIKAPRIIKGLNEEVNQKALEKLKQMPKWIPGKKDRVPADFNIPYRIMVKKVN